MTETADDGGWTVFVLPSSHNDIGWAGTPTEIAEHRADAIVDTVLDMMELDPGYTFAMEAGLYLHEYLERRPAQSARVLHYIAQGRLEWGAAYIQPYEALLSGESLIRQLYWGRRWMRQRLDVDAPGYWNIDVEARTGQMPQILAKAGVRYMVLSRNEPGLYWWESPDGSRILTLSFMEGAYGRARVFDTLGLHFSPLEAGHVYGENPVMSVAGTARELVPLLQRWEPFFAAHHLPRYFLVAATADYTVPDRRIGALIQQWNAQVDTGELELPMPVRLRFGNAAQYVTALQTDSDLSDLPVVRGELPNPWVYIHGPCHHKTVAAMRGAVSSLRAAEIFTAAATLSGRAIEPRATDDLARAWTDHLYPDHGYGGLHGEGTDEVFRAKEESALFTARRVAGVAMFDLACAVPQPPDRHAVRSLVVFNPLSWPRTDWVEADVFFASDDAVTSVDLVDADGNPEDMQILDLSRTGDGRLQRLRLGLIAREVPSVGYRTYYLRASAAILPTGLTPLEALLPADYEWENDALRARASRGGLVELYDKVNKCGLLAADHYLGCEVVELGSPGHDVGEGERDITVFDWQAVRPFQPTPRGVERTSDRAGAVTVLENGPLRDAITTKSDFSHAVVRQTFYFYRDLDRVDVMIDIENWDGTHGRELRLVFPLSSQRADISYDVPFGHVRVGHDEVEGFAGLRPREVQSWLHAEGGESVLTFSSSVVAHDWVDPLSSTDRPVLQAVLLATKRSCHHKGPWYTQEGHHRFSASLSGRPRSVEGRTRFGMERQQPLEVVTVGRGDLPTAPSLPAAHSFLTIEPDNVMVTTLKHSENGDGFIVRCHEVAGTHTEAIMRLATPVRMASRCDVLEGNEEQLWITDHPRHTLTLPLHPFEVATVKLNP